MTTRIALQDLRAADLMQRDLITVHVDDPLREVERVLVDAQVSSVPVLDEAGGVLGVVSMRDVVSRYADADNQDDDEDDDGEPDWLRGDEPTAGDLMSTDLLRVTPDTALPAMARTMAEHACHRVLVVERSRLLGMVSSRDVLRAISATVDPACGSRRSSAAARDPRPR